MKTIDLRNDIIFSTVLRMSTEKLNGELCHVYVHRH